MPNASRPSSPDPPLIARVAAVLAREGASGTGVVIAVSGGADSTALLRLLAALREEQRLRLTTAHLDHALRPDSAEDAAWVADLCRELEVPLISRRVPPTDGTAVSEAIAREWRRRFLSEAAREANADWVAAAHTADDQAETVLHRLLRGTGVRGLAGIGVVAPLDDRVRLIRPLLGTTRAELEAWLRTRGYDWRIDATNADLRFTRNRIRHQLLPQLREEYNPQVATALCRLAEQAREQSDWLVRSAEAVLETALLHESLDAVRLSLEPLTALPRVLLREVFVCLWQRAGWRAQGMSSEHWESLAASVLEPGDMGRFQLPHGVDVEREGTLLRLVRRSPGA